MWEVAVCVVCGRERRHGTGGLPDGWRRFDDGPVCGVCQLHEALDKNRPEPNPQPQDPTP